MITSINSTWRMNVRLIRVSQFFSPFNLNIRYKSNKDHIVSNALSRFTSVNVEFLSKKYLDLNVLFTYNTIFVAMFDEFHDKILQEYKKNSVWKKILTTMLNNERFEENATNLSFDTITIVSTKTDVYIKSRFKSSDVTSTSISFNLLYHIDKLIELRRLCIFDSCIENFMKIAHDNDHFEFVRCFDMIFQTWYVRNLIKALRNYIKHGSKCFVLQTRRHKLWESFQSINTSFVSFHIITFDFILAMSLSIDLHNVIMSIIDKFTKRTTLISKKNIYKAKTWAITLIKRLEIVDWEYLKIIISDRDRKFFFEF